MLAIISPAKSLDFSEQSQIKKATQPAFLNDSQELIEVARKLSAHDLEELMGISANLAELNRQRFHDWKVPFPKGESKQALLAFTGDVYRGFDLASFKEEDFAFAHEHLRILSGLYGLLRPLDQILPYRLEMGIKLKTAKGSTLYEFWGDRLTKALNQALRKQGDDILVNLASNEYFHAVKQDVLKARLITPVFKDTKNGKLKIISFYAKRARGMMADYMIRNRLTDVEELKGFSTEGYGYADDLSKGDELVFTRAER